MNDLKDNFIHLRHELQLTAEERSVMRSHLEHISETLTPASIPSPFLTFFSMPMRYATAFILLLLVTGSGTSALAQGSLPGDTLYSLKVRVNEPVERTFARTPEAKADVDIKHAEERLTEVELLAARGDADPEQTKIAAASVEEKVIAATEAAKELYDDGDASAADGIHARINSALLAHADILDAQAEELATDSQQTLRALSVAVAVAVNDADEAHDADSSEDENSDDDIARIALERETAARERIAALTKVLGADGVPQETQDELTAELAHIEADFGAAREQMADEDFKDAGEEYAEVEQRAYRALALLISAKRINESTGKEVFVTLTDTTTEDNQETANTAPVMMKAMLMTAPASTTMELAPQSSRRHRERMFQFIVRDPMSEDSSGKD